MCHKKLLTDILKISFNFVSLQFSNNILYFIVHGLTNDKISQT
jgi:hypothetical protein